MPKGKFTKPKERADKISRALQGNTNAKGNIAWNKGKPHSKEHKRNLRKSAKSGKDNHKWKGEKVGYRALHNWVEKNKPKPKVCESCKKDKRLTAANISGDYKRDIEDYKWLCYKCHKNYDIGDKN